MILRFSASVTGRKEESMTLAAMAVWREANVKRFKWESENLSKMVLIVYGMIKNWHVFKERAVESEFFHLPCNSCKQFNYS